MTVLRLFDKLAAIEAETYNVPVGVAEGELITRFALTHQELIKSLIEKEYEELCKPQ